MRREQNKKNQMKTKSKTARTDKVINASTPVVMIPRLFQASM